MSRSRMRRAGLLSTSGEQRRAGRPHARLGWLSTSKLFIAIAAAILAPGGVAAEPMIREIDAAVAEVQFVPIPL